MSTANPTAAILLIGNEILSGKVRDENAHFLNGLQILTDLVQAGDI